MSVSAILFLIFVFLKPLYLFPSGGLGVGDAVLAAAFLSAMIRRFKKKRHGLLYREDYFFYAFLVCVFLVNGWYYILSPHNDFIRNTAYWIYGCMLLWTLRGVAEEKNFLLYLNRILKLILVVQLAVYVLGTGRIYYEYWDANRYMGTFNNPNQMAYVLFLTILLIYFYDSEHHRRSFWLFYIIDGFLVLLTKSTGIFLGWMLLAAGIGCICIYRQYKAGRISGRFLCCMGGILAAALIIGLWMIWPEQGFTIQDKEYNILTRIQEKLALLSQGGVRKLIIDRGGEKILYYPQYLLYGAGEGSFERFPLAVVWKSEIHSTLFSIWFSYGIIPMVLIMVWLWRNVKCAPVYYWPVYMALLAESMTVINYRQPFFWMILAYAGIKSASHNYGEGSWISSKNRIDCSNIMLVLCNRQ